MQTAGICSSSSTVLCGVVHAQTSALLLLHASMRMPGAVSALGYGHNRFLLGAGASCGTETWLCCMAWP